MSAALRSSATSSVRPGAQHPALARRVRPTPHPPLARPRSPRADSAPHGPAAILPALPTRSSPLLPPHAPSLHQQRSTLARPTGHQSSPSSSARPLPPRVRPPPAPAAPRGEQGRKRASRSASASTPRRGGASTATRRRPTRAVVRLRQLRRRARRLLHLPRPRRGRPPSLAASTACPSAPRRAQGVRERAPRPALALRRSVRPARRVRQPQRLARGLGHRATRRGRSLERQRGARPRARTARAAGSASTPPRARAGGQVEEAREDEGGESDGHVLTRAREQRA